MAARSARAAAKRPRKLAALDTRARVHTMTSFEQVRALTHPLRLRLIELFAEEPRTTKQVAGILGGSVTRLYHHVNALERLGMLRLVETRQNRGTTEKYFQATARRYEVDRALFTGRARPRGADRIADVVFEQARADLLEALRGDCAQDPATAPLVLRAAMRATPTQIAVLRRELVAFLQRAVRKIRAGRPAGGVGVGHYALTIGLMPAASPPAGERRAPRKRTAR